MAKKMKKAEAKAEAKAEKKGKKNLTPEQLEKRKARLEAIKNRPAGQRPNSRQVDIIELGDGSKVINYGYAIRKTGTLVTSVLVGKDGKVISNSVCFIAGTKTKSKKQHGTIVPGLAGVGKGEPEDEEEDEDSEESED